MARCVVAGVALIATSAFASPSLFTSKAPYEQLVAKLKSSGGDASRILHVRSSKDLMRLESGKRYKFVLDETGTLSVGERVKARKFGPDAGGRSGGFFRAA